MRKFEVVKKEFRKHEGDIILPTRSDTGSAGYDFHTPCDFTIAPGETVHIVTDVKIAMEQDEVLLLFGRSSMGIKKRINLATGVSVIDATFYGNDVNDGNLTIVLTSFSNETHHFVKGDKIAQGVFMKYLITDDDNTTNTVRSGGIGSTGR